MELFPKDLTASDDDVSVAMHLASAFASLVLGVLMYFCAIACHHAKLWRSMNDIMRWFIQNYGVVIVLVI